MNNRLLKIAVALMMMLALVLAASAQAESVVIDAQKLDAYYSLAINYISHENYEKAMENLNNCLKYCSEDVNPELYADVHLKIGCVDTIQKQYEDAVRELDEAIRVQPELSEAYLVRTQVYTESEDFAKAAENLERYIALSGVNNMYETLTQLYTQAGNTEKALESYKAFVDNDTQDQVEAAYRMGIYKLETEQYAEAIPDFEVCRENAVYGPSSIYNIAVCYMHLEDYENALANFKACTSEEAQYDGLYYNTGVCSMLLEQTTEAIEAFIKVIK